MHVHQGIWQCILRTKLAPNFPRTTINVCRFVSYKLVDKLVKKLGRRGRPMRLAVHACSRVRVARGDPLGQSTPIIWAYAHSRVMTQKVEVAYARLP
jgi:hypothetical protein